MNGLNMKYILFKITLVVATLALLVGCGNADATLDKRKVKVASESDDVYQFDEVIINGKNCIILFNDVYGSPDVVTFDCDWSNGQG